MDKVLVSSKMATNTKENCSMDCFMAKALSPGLMALSIKASLLWMKSLAWAVTNGQMAQSLKVLLRMDLEMVMANILMIRKELSMKANGLMECAMAKVLLLIKMGQFMKEIGIQAWNVEKEKWLIQAEIIMKVSGITIREMEWALCIG